MSSFQRDKIIQDMVAVAKKRTNHVLSAPSNLTDKEWAEIQAIVRKKGPLPREEMLTFIKEYGRAASYHFLSLVFEVEALYEIINQLVQDDRP